MTQKSVWTRLFGRQFPLESETAWFILVNVLDMVVTWLLIRTGTFRESNPIAVYFLHRWGIRGMNVFKLSTVILVVVIAQVIAPIRPATARGLLIAGTVIVGAVVCYSVVLAIRSPAF